MMRSSTILFLLALMLWMPLRSGWAQGYTLVFQGNAAFTEMELLEALEFDRGILDREFTITAVDDAAFMLQLFYEKAGFDEAKVSFEFNGAARAAVFRINEGELVTVRELTITGTDVLPNELLLERFRASLTRDGANLLFSEESASSGFSDVVGTLADAGYLAAEGELIITSPSRTERDIRIELREGPLFEIRQIRIRGDLIESEEFLLERLTELRQGTYTRDLVYLMRASLFDFYRSRGYYDVSLEFQEEISEATGQVDVAFNITSGVLYTVESIEFTGLDRTRESIARARLKLEPGDVYDTEHVQNSIRQLLTTGAFDNMVARPTRTGNGRLAVTMAATESKAKSFAINLGAGSWEGPRGKLIYEDNNFLGLLRQFRAETFGSLKSMGASVSLANPGFLNRELRSETTVFYTSSEQPAFELTEYGILFSVEKRWNARHTTIAQIGVKDVFDSSSEVIDPDGLLEEYRLGSVSLGHRWDTRPNPINPNTGFLVDARTELASSALLGDVDYLRTRVRGSYYLPWVQPTEARPSVPFSFVAGRVGVISGTGGRGSVPLQERFFNGGSTTVRSFAEDELGRQDINGKPLGGNSVFSVNFETQFPIRESLFLAAFADAGALSADANPFGGETRYGVGLGVRYYTPIAALRVDYGWNPDQREGESMGALHFGIGFAF